MSTKIEAFSTSQAATHWGNLVVGIVRGLANLLSAIQGSSKFRIDLTGSVAVAVAK
jgi:hypothetical protein